MNGTQQVDNSVPAFPSLLVWLYTGIGILNVAGILSNASLVYVTVRCKTLRNHCNKLIAIYAAGAALLLAGYALKCFILRFGINYIKMSTCVRILALPLFGAAVAIIGQTLIAVERLLCALFPIWYKMNSKCLFYCLLAVCIVQAIHVCVLYLYIAMSTPDARVSCTFMDLYAHSAVFSRYASIKAFGVYAAEFVCYSLLWLTMVWRKPDSQKTRQLMRSLNALLAISMFCFLLSIAWAQFVVPNLHFGRLDDQLNMEYFGLVPTQYLNCGAYAAIAPTLFCFSKEYRNAYYKCFFGQQVAPMANNGIQNRQWAVPVSQQLNS